MKERSPLPTVPHKEPEQYIEKLWGTLNLNASNKKGLASSKGGGPGDWGKSVGAWRWTGEDDSRQIFAGLGWFAQPANSTSMVSRFDYTVVDRFFFVERRPYHENDKGGNQVHLASKSVLKVQLFITCTTQWLFYPLFKGDPTRSPSYLCPLYLLEGGRAIVPIPPSAIMKVRAHEPILKRWKEDNVTPEAPCNYSLHVPNGADDGLAAFQRYVATLPGCCVVERGGKYYAIDKDGKIQATLI